VRGRAGGDAEQTELTSHRHLQRSEEWRSYGLPPTVSLRLTG
jgi:hypothetical protein